MNANEEVSYWLEIQTEDGESLEGIVWPGSLNEIQHLTSGLTLSPHQSSLQTKDFFIAVGKELSFDERRFKVTEVSVRLREAKAGGEMRVFVTVEEL